MKPTATHHPKHPAVGIATSGRELALIAMPDDEALCGVTIEEAGQTTIRLFRRSGKPAQDVTADPTGQCHKACLFGAQDGTALLAWNAYDAGVWRIYCHNVADNGRKPIPVHRSHSFVLPPVGTSDGTTSVLAWTERVDGQLRVMLASSDGDTWSKAAPISPEGVDACRPALCCPDDGVVIAWDEYNNNRYEVATARWTHGGWALSQRVGMKAENWFMPRLLARGNDVYMTFVASRKVMNSRKIVDHACHGLVGRLTTRGIDLLAEGNTTETLAVADMREGLLAKVTHHNYTGLRRNPMLLPGAEETLWCVWERRNPAADHGEAGGELVGRRYDAGTRAWDSLLVLHEGGKSYATSPVSPGQTAIAFYRHGDTDGTVCFSDLDLAGGATFKTSVMDATPWADWTPQDRISVPAIPASAVVDDRPLNCYWVDTHCHGHYSGDAEGEVDELIRYARDIAHLDAVCITDNDYYPSKALTPAEWQLQQEFAEHFTVPGCFVAFSGYEFTCWEEESINHRILLYAEKGGTLHRRIDTGTQTVADLYAQLAADAVTPLPYAHHVAYDLAAGDSLVEICSSWRVGMVESTFTCRQLAAGKRIGFVGSSDTHRAVPGMGGAITGIYAEALTASALLDALRKRRTVVSQGFRIAIDFRVNDLFIGDEGSVRGAPRLTGRIRAPRTIETVEVFRDGEPSHAFHPDASDFAFCYPDGTSKGEHCYHLQIELTGEAGFNVAPRNDTDTVFVCEGNYPHNLARHDGRYAWTSPIVVLLK